MKWLQGKKTIIGGILAGLLVTVFSVDLLVHDNTATVVQELGWMSKEWYLMVGGWITAWTTVSVRLAMKKP